MTFSDVMFVTTANTLNIPPPLMDRMEIIRIAGYTEDEKVEIARRHLIPAALKKHGLAPVECEIEQSALQQLRSAATRARRAFATLNAKSPTSRARR